MKSVTTYPPHSPSIEQGFQAMVHDIQAKASGTLESYEAKIRQSPDKAILIALATGYALHIVPKRSLIMLPIRLTAFLAKPALLAFGAMKVCELMENQARK